jgi:hypothetical protein
MDGFFFDQVQVRGDIDATRLLFLEIVTWRVAARRQIFVMRPCTTRLWPTQALGSLP